MTPSPGVVHRLCEWSSTPRRQLPGGSRVRAAISARSVQVVRGRGVHRRSTELVAQNRDIDLLRTVRLGAQHNPAQEPEIPVDQPKRHRWDHAGLLT